MRLRTWLPPGAARGLGRRLLLTVALAPPIAWLAQAVLPGTAGYGTALTRSLAISLFAWAAVDLGRFLLRGSSAQRRRIIGRRRAVRRCCSASACRPGYSPALRSATCWPARPQWPEGWVPLPCSGWRWALR